MTTIYDILSNSYFLRNINYFIVGQGLNAIANLTKISKKVKKIISDIDFKIYDDCLGPLTISFKIKKTKKIIKEFPNFNWHLTLNEGQRYNYRPYDTKNILSLGDIHTLDLSLSSIWDVSEFSNINIHTLYLSYCRRIKDVSNLGNLHTLDLSNCDQISDVSNLGNLHTLILKGCYKLEDVSMLGNLNTLNIRGCINIVYNEKNKTALKRIPNLKEKF